MRIMSLMYHDVRPKASESQTGADRVEDWYALTPDGFSSHLDAIATSPLTPSVVTDGGGPDRLFLTFDDGEISAIDTVAPMLERRGWRGHFFVVSSWIGKPGFLTDEDLRALVSRGHIVGGHGHMHPIMTELDEPAIRDEWRMSREILEEILGQAVTVASVPTGHYTAPIGRLAIEAGYRQLFTSEPWLKPRPLLSGTIYGRFMVRRGTTAESVAAFCSFSRPVLARQRLAWETRKVLKTTMGKHYEGFRRAVIARL
jgi:peptidoglycan/xylan/chitin deacetylase (PgdA/CDA1 family)